MARAANVVSLHVSVSVFFFFFRVESMNDQPSRTNNQVRIAYQDRHILLARLFISQRGKKG